MKKTTLQTIGLVVGLAAIVAAAPVLWSIQLHSGSVVDGGLAVGRPMPVIEGVEWVNGPSPTAADLEGKVIVVNAWRISCPHCTKHMPELVALRDKFAEDVVIIGMTGEPVEQVKSIEAHLARLDVTWPNAVQARRSMRDYEVRAIPRTWVVGRDGKVVWNRATQNQTLSEAVEQALASKG